MLAKHKMDARDRRIAHVWQPHCKVSTRYTPHLSKVSTRQVPGHARVARSIHHVSGYRWVIFELFWVTLIFLGILKELLDILMFNKLIKDKI